MCAQNVLAFLAIALQRLICMPLSSMYSGAPNRPSLLNGGFRVHLCVRYSLVRLQFILVRTCCATVDMVAKL